MRKLASVQKIEAIHPIEGRDQIGLAVVLGWQVIVRYDQFREGDLCVYCEVDSVLPEVPEFEFLRKCNFRIKTMKMAGVVSQGLCLPMSHLPNGNYAIGDDVTELLHITKYEPQEEVQQDDAEPNSKKKVSKFRQWMFRCPVTAGLAQQIWGNSIKRKSFPDFIAKTDETRIQSMPFMLNRKDITFEAHEKVDGQSGTFFLRKYKKLFGLRTEYDFGVCSRNLRLFREDSSSYWSVVNRYHIRDVLRKLLDDCKDGSEWVCIQGECVAPSVQGNKYHVDKSDLYCFNLITEKRGKIDSLEAEKILCPHGLKWVPLVEANYRLPDTIQEIEAYAHGDSQLYPTLREGIVFRNYEKGISFKCVDPLFLLKWKE